MPGEDDATARELEEEQPIQARSATGPERRRKRSSSPRRGEEDRNAFMRGVESGQVLHPRVGKRGNALEGTALGHPVSYLRTKRRMGRRTAGRLPSPKIERANQERREEDALQRALEQEIDFDYMRRIWNWRTRFGNCSNEAFYMQDGQRWLQAVEVGWFFHRHPILLDKENGRDSPQTVRRHERIHHQEVPRERGHFQNGPTMKEGLGIPMRGLELEVVRNGEAWWGGTPQIIRKKSSWHDTN